MPFLLVIGAVCALILKEPHLSATVLIGMTTLIMLFVGGAHMIHMTGLGIRVFNALMLTINKPYRLRRLLSFLNPWENPSEEGIILFNHCMHWVLEGLLV